MSRWDRLVELYDGKQVGHFGQAILQLAGWTYWTSYMTVSRWDILAKLYDSEQVGHIGHAI